MTDKIRDFITTTCKIKSIRAAHAPELKLCRETKQATQDTLLRVLMAHGATCVPVGDQYIRIKTSRSKRAITEDIARTALSAVPSAVLEAGSLDEAAAAVAHEVHQVRTFEKEYAAFDKMPERGGPTNLADPSPIQEAAEAYATATTAYQEATAAQKLDLGEHPEQLKAHERRALDFLGEEKSLRVNLTGADTGTFYVRRKETKKRPPITVETLTALAKTAVRRVRRDHASVDRDAIVAELLSCIEKMPRTVSTRVTLSTMAGRKIGPYLIYNTTSSHLRVI